MHRLEVNRIYVSNDKNKLRCGHLRSLWSKPNSPHDVYMTAVKSKIFTWLQEFHIHGKYLFSTIWFAIDDFTNVRLNNGILKDLTFPECIFFLLYCLKNDMTRTEINFDTLERLFAPTFEIMEQRWPSQELFLKPQSRYLVGLGSKTLLLDSIT